MTLKISLITIIILLSLSQFALNTTLDSLCPPIVISELEDMKSIILNPENIIGKGGFGIVFKNDERAIKVVKLEITNNNEVKNFVKEVEISKNLHQNQQDSHHVPNFDFCLELDYENFGETLLKYFEKDSEKEVKNKAQIHSSRTDKAQEVPEVKTTFGFFAISMERLSHDVDWFNNQYSNQMILLERIRMTRSLAEHLKFVTQDSGYNHCDVKPENFMIKNLTSEPHEYEDSLAVLSMFPQNFLNYSSRVIDFGGIVPHDSQCRIYTPGYVPIDDVLYQGDGLTNAKPSSNKNDVFALGITSMLALDLASAKSIHGFSIFFFLKIKAIQKLINTVYSKQIEVQKEVFSQLVQLGMQGQIREMTINAIAPQIIQQLDFLFDILKTVHFEINPDQIKAPPTDSELIVKWFSDSTLLIENISAIFQNRIELLEQEAKKRALIEAVQIFNSYNISKSAMPDHKEQSQVYVGLQSQYMSILKSCLSFDKIVRPDFESLIESLRNLEHQVEMFMQNVRDKQTPINRHRKNNQTFKDPSLVNFNKFLTLMHESEKPPQTPAEKKNSQNGRILLRNLRLEENPQFQNLNFMSDINLYNNQIDNEAFQIENHTQMINLTDIEQADRTNVTSNISQGENQEQFNHALNLGQMIDRVQDTVLNNEEVRRAQKKSASQARVQNIMEDFISSEILKKIQKRNRIQSAKYVII